MYNTVTTSSGITYTQDGPAVLTGDRTLLKMAGPRRVGAEIVITDNNTHETVARLKNALPSNPAGGNTLVFDLTDAMRIPSGGWRRQLTATITPYMVAPGTLDDWQQLPDVTLSYNVRHGRTLPDRSYSSAKVIPVMAGENVQYYCPNVPTSVTMPVSLTQVSGNGTWVSLPWDGSSRSLNVVTAADFLRGSIPDGFDNTQSWSVRLWAQRQPLCVPFVVLRYYSHDGCQRSVYAEIEGRDISAEAMEWNDMQDFGRVRNSPRQIITRARVDYPLIIRGVPEGCDLAEIAMCERVTVESGRNGMVAAVSDLKMTENIYKTYDYRLKVTVLW
jgi:hypothetical protein